MASILDEGRKSSSSSFRGMVEERRFGGAKHPGVACIEDNERFDIREGSMRRVGL